MTEDSVVHACNMQYNLVHKDFFFWGGGGGRDIERKKWPGSSDIFGQDQCEHMLNLVMFIAIFSGHGETTFDSNC